MDSSNKMIAEIVLVCLAALATVQAGPITGRIVGGHEAAVGAFPYQVSIQYGWSFLKVHACGGSILNSKWILTAGHCITDVSHLPFANYFVVAGIHNVDDKGQTFKVKRSVVHPDFIGVANPNDLALLELNGELTFGPRVGPVQLPNKDEIYSGTTTISGWGSTSTSVVEDMPKNLQTIDVETITLYLISHSKYCVRKIDNVILMDELCSTLPIFSQCAEALVALVNSTGSLVETNLCTGPFDVKGEGVCSGDSGSPLVEQGVNVQIGVTSWTIFPCGQKGSPSVFTRVSAFVDWIIENTN